LENTFLSGRGSAEKSTSPGKAIISRNWEKYHDFLSPDDEHRFLVRPDKDSDSAEQLLCYDDALLNNSVAGYDGGIVTPCLPELKVNRDFASV